MLLVLMNPQRQARLLWGVVWGLRQLGLVLLIAQHGIRRLLVVCYSGHQTMCLLLLLMLLPLSLQLAWQ